MTIWSPVSLCKVRDCIRAPRNLMLLEPAIFSSGVSQLVVTLFLLLNPVNLRQLSYRFFYHVILS